MPAQFKSFELDKRYTFDHLVKGSQTLLVTIGDSWTWGYGIGTTEWNDGKAFESEGEKHKRLQSIFGTLLANEINSDFLNLSYPGQSNGWIAEYFDKFIEHLETKMDYKKVIVIITMSEVGREWMGEFDPPVDYYKFCGDITSINDFFKRQSEKIAGKIINTQKKIIEKNLPVQVIKAVGFVEDNYPQGFIDCDKTWQHVLCEHGGMPYEKYDLYLCQSAVVEKLHWLLEYNNNHYVNYEKVKKDKPTLPEETFQDQRLALLDKIDRFNNIIYNNKLNTWRSDLDRGHPSAEGHSAWADHLIKKLI